MFPVKKHFRQRKSRWGEVCNMPAGNNQKRALHAVWTSSAEQMEINNQPQNNGAPYEKTSGTRKKMGISYNTKTVFHFFCERPALLETRHSVYVYSQLCTIKPSLSIEYHHMKIFSFMWSRQLGLFRRVGKKLQSFKFTHSSKAYLCTETQKVVTF